MTAPNFAVPVGTPEEQRAAAAAAEDVLTGMGIGALPTGDAEFILPRASDDVEGGTVAHNVDATKSPYDNLDAMPAGHPWSPTMINSKPKPVTAEEAQQKATVMADYLDRPMPEQSPERANYIAQMTEHLVGLSRAEFEDWKRENLDPTWH